MTTPQNELWNLSYKINNLIKMFENEGEELSVFDNVKQLYIIVQALDKRMDILQDQMSLIIKLLSKSDERA